MELEELRRRNDDSERCLNQPDAAVRPSLGENMTSSSSEFGQRSFVPAVLAWLLLLPACRDSLYEQNRGLPDARLSVSLNEATVGSRQFTLHVGVTNASANELVSLVASGGLTLSFAGAAPRASLCNVAAYDQVFELFASPTADNLSVQLGTSPGHPDGGADLRPCSEAAGFTVEEPFVLLVPAVTANGVGVDGGRSDAASGQGDASQTDSGSPSKHDGGPPGGSQDSGSKQDAGQTVRTQNDAMVDGAKDR